MPSSESKSYNIIWLDVTDSTNLEAKRQVDRLGHLSCIAAKCQNNGKGQGDHVWISDPGMNLTFSLVLKPWNLFARDEQSISWAVTTGILDYLSDKGIKARIKWPNDIWVQDFKICGILVENVLNGALVQSSIVGLGLNLNQNEWPGDLPNPVSLSQLTGREYRLETELELLLIKICRRLELIGSADGRNSLQGEFENNMFKLA